MFDLKKGFKFYDKGHSNEQITLVRVNEFYSHKLKDKLSKKGD